MRNTPAHIPVSTYRLQFHERFTLADACALVDYLADLGIGDAYASPLSRSREHSAHGYDVIDHHQIGPELGSEDDLKRWADELNRRRLGLMLDVVPNHMGIDDPHNVWWHDLLENGVGSQFARFFDVDWRPPKEVLRGKVLLPILGDQYGRVLENQEITLVYENQTFQVAYYNRRFPLSPGTWPDVLRGVLDEVTDVLDADNPERMELESIITALDNLPTGDEQDPERIQQRYREKEVARRRFAGLLESSVPIRHGLDRAIKAFNGEPGDPHSFDRLEELLSKQAYRLAYWRVATDEINYRRFFDINELAAIRVEDPEVFESVHELVFRFVERGWVTALRIDHPDGLLDPQQYFQNLQDKFAEIKHRAQGGDQYLPEQPTLYIAVEKILGHDEGLPADWNVAGTTGYDFLNLLNGIFVDRPGAVQLRSNYSRLTGQPMRYLDTLYESKKTILNVSMSSELHVLAWQLDRISEQHRWSRDFTQTSLRRALREVIACFPVYRSYIRPGSAQVSEEDRQHIAMAIRIARRRNPEMSHTFFDFIESVLLLDDPEGLGEDGVRARRQFVLKFQQVTGPVTAKGVEDTAFYRNYPLASLNEVGGEPMALGTTLEQFHRKNTERAAAWPYSMLATATHDTKRGEDVRARLNVLAEIPVEWNDAVCRWLALNEPRRAEVDGAPAPDANEEYLLYQTLVGTWPSAGAIDDAYVERIAQYMGKALKEAKLHTSWLNANQEYDDAVAGFVRDILAAVDFTADMTAFVASIADAGFVNSLAQTLLKIAAPGVPDFYQGTELWDFSLVDPDNRRPVDFELRRAILAEFKTRGANEAELAEELLAAWPDPRLKLYLIWRALDFRRRHADLMLRGSYLPLAIEGDRADHAVAFARERDGRWAVAVAPRLTLPAWRAESERAAGWPLAPWWRGTRVRVPGRLTADLKHVVAGNWIAGASDGAERVFDLADVFDRFPVALLSA